MIFLPTNVHPIQSARTTQVIGLLNEVCAMDVGGGSRK